MVFFEKQYGALCAQHALNALLQGPYFTAVELATIAAELDREELASLDEATREVVRKEGSSNMDDSGFFSVQVIQRALQVWGLALVPWNNPDVQAIRRDPAAADSFICNQDSHWFTFRKLDNQWFNLDSTLDHPQRVSSTLIELTLSQLECEQHSIFAVVGELPSIARGASAEPAALAEEDDDDFKRALALSLADAGRPAASSGGHGIPGTDSTLPRPQSQPVQLTDEDDMDDDLRTAIALSMSSATEEPSGPALKAARAPSREAPPPAGSQAVGAEPEAPPSQEELRRLRQLRFG